MRQADNKIKILIEKFKKSRDLNNRIEILNDLSKLQEKNHFLEFKNFYLKESFSEIKSTLIPFIIEFYPDQGMEFLVSQYRQEKDWKVRNKIIEAIGLCKNRNSLLFLIEALKDNNVENKRLAISLLGRMKAEEASEPLISMLQHGMNELYDDIIKAIVNIGKKNNLKAILAHINQENIYIKRAIPIILARLKDKSSQQILLKLLEDPDREVRKNSIKALVHVLDLRKIGVLFKKLQDDNLEIRKETIKALGELGSLKAIKPLLKLLLDKKFVIRSQAMKALTKLFIKAKTHEELYEVLEKRNLLGRQSAIKILGQIGSPEDIKRLLPFFTSKIPQIRQNAFKSILKIAQNTEFKEESLVLIIQSLNSEKWQIRKYSANLLSKLGDENTIEALFVLLGDDNNEVRKAAIQTLATFRTSKVIDIAKQFLTDDSWKMRRAAVKLLLKIGTEEALSPLMNCLNDDDIYVKRWAIKGLGKLRSFSNLSALSRLLKDKDPKIRLSVVKAFEQIGEESVIPYLIDALGDDVYEIKREAEKALEKIDPFWIEKYL
ncbi:MAG: HEAT repeat domain-containing protein [Promethearchaeota archaeon]